ncbi:hypothetical protein V1281_002581 [Nitrobacteraceae bacterium AZCC 2161]
MADTQDAIQRLTILTAAPGADQAAASLRGVQGAMDGVTVASQNTDKATLSLDGKFASIERRYNTALRNQQDYAKLQNQVNLAVAQNPALQDRANAVLAAAADKYGQVTGAQKAFGIASQTVNLQVAALASGLGLTGQVLSAFGPWGFAAAVGLGAVQSALSLASEKSHELAQKAKEIKEFSEATGLTTTQFQALRSEAGKFGIDSESLASGLSKFTSGFENLRLGQGDLLTQIRRINPAIADQMQQTTDAATAFTLFGKAVEATDNIFQRNALLKAGMGKGASTFGAFFESAPDVSALTASFASAGRGLDENLIQKLKQLQIDIDRTKSAANTTFALIFGSSTLEGEKAYAQGLLEIAKYAREFSLSADFHKLIDYKVGANAGTAVSVGAGAATGAAIGAAGGAFFGGIGALPGAGFGALAGAIAALISDKTAEEIKKIAPGSLTGGTPPSMANFVSPSNSYSKFQEIAPKEQPKKTDQAKLADMEKTVTLLGSAATATEKYDMAILKLKQGQDGFTLSTKDYNRAVSALDLDKSAAQIGARVGALGAAATVTDLLTQKNVALAQAQRNGANLTPTEIANQQRLVIEQANGVGAVNAQIDAVKVQSATIGMSAGAAAEYTAIQTKMNEAIRAGSPLNVQQEAELRKSAAALREETQAAAKRQINDQIKEDRQTIGFAPEDQQIAQALKQLYPDITERMNSTEAAQMRLNNQMREMKDISSGFANDLVGGLMRGEDAMKAMGTAATNLIQKLGSKQLSNFMNGGDFFGKQDLNSAQGGLTVASAGVSAYQSGNAATGALSGAMAGATFGPAGAVVGGAAGLIGGILGADAQQRAKLEAAQKAWKEAGPAFQKFLTEMSGGVQGDLATTFQNQFQVAHDLAVKAWDAHDFSAITTIYESLAASYQRQAKNFMATFDASLKGMADGLGLNSPFLGAVNTVKTQLAAMQGFIDDARVSTGTLNGGIEPTTGQLKPLASADMIAVINEAQAKATAAAETYLLSLLQTAPALSTVQTALQNMNGTAAALQTSLVQLGMSSESAAAEIRDGVSKALDAIKSQFQESLSGRLNAANGQGFLNDAAAVVKQHQQDMADAASLGIDPSQVNAVFHAEAQKIVDDAALVGDAFNNFLIQFPQLAGVVDQSSATLAQAAADQAKAAQDAADSIKKALNDTAAYVQQIGKTIRDYLNGLRAGSSSTLNPQDKLNAAQAQFNAQFALAQAGDRAALGTITQYSDTLLGAAKEFYGSAAGYSAIFTDITSKLQSIPENLTVSQVTAADQIVAAIQAQQAATVSKLQDGTVQTVAAQYAAAGQTVTALYNANGQIVGVTVAQTGAILDTNGAVAGTTGAIQATAAQSDALTLAQNSLLSTSNAIADSQVSLANSQVGILSSINGLQSTASAQLMLLNQQYAAQPFTVGVNGGSVSVNNTMVQALNKIVYNTYAISMNTLRTNRDIGGTLATGGLVKGPGSGTSDSIPMWLSNREYVIKNATLEKFGVGFFDQLNAGMMPASDAVNASRSPSPPISTVRAGNDNLAMNAVASELRQLRAEVARFRQENKRSHEVVGTEIVKAVDRSTDATHDGTRERKMTRG